MPKTWMLKLWQIPKTLANSKVFISVVNLFVKMGQCAKYCQVSKLPKKHDRPFKGQFSVDIQYLKKNRRSNPLKPHLKRPQH